MTEAAKYRLPYLFFQHLVRSRRLIGAHAGGTGNPMMCYVALTPEERTAYRAAAAEVAAMSRAKNRPERDVIAAARETVSLLDSY